MLARELLCGNHILIGSSPVDDDILDILHRVEAAMPHTGHDRVDLVRKHTLLGLGTEEAHEGIENYY